MSNKRFLDFTTDETPSGSNYLLEADSANGVRKTTIENAVLSTNAFADINAKTSNLWDNAGAHNSIYRGKDLTAYFNSGEMSAAIASGTFDDIYPGDMIWKDITISGNTYHILWIVGELNYHYGLGSLNNNKNHVLMLPRPIVIDAAMNDTDSTEGGYIGSKFYTQTLPLINAALQNAFGSEHVMEHTERLSNAVSNGKSSASRETTVLANIPNEVMMMGNDYKSSSYYDTMDCNHQIAAIRHNNILAFDHLMNMTQANMWTRSVAGNESFVIIQSEGTSGSWLGAHERCAIRPYFLLK